MEIIETSYRRIEDCLKRQRGHVSLSNLEGINAILHPGRAGLPMARLPQTLGQLAYDR